GAAAACMLLVAAFGSARGEETSAPAPAPKPAPAPEGTGSAASGTEAVAAPDPRIVLARIAADVLERTKKSSFFAQCFVEGGVAATPDHKVIKVRTADLFSAEIFQGIMRVSEYDAFRTFERGAIKRMEKADWQDTASDIAGRRVERLLSFPHEILEEAAAHGGSVEWKLVGDEKEIVAKKEEGRTGVVETRAKLPHLLRIEFSHTRALEQLERIRNSGCMDANTVTECTGISQFIANLDRSDAKSFCEIDLAPDHSVPKSIRFVVLAGVKKPTLDEDDRVPGGEEHVAFHFDYTLDRWDAVEEFAIPKGARKVLRLP
ncbi:MAG: hypothetical protein L0Z55_03025, partial [Planctomycetes bacterium]|nr:hypothetical protein [Planctomycetota bacterium]